MEFTVRRFARNILLLHVLLLAALLGVVFFASREIEDGARQQAVEQARIRQEQLATQTAKGIEGFYQSILSDMDLLPRSDETSAERSVLPDVLTRTSTRTPLGQRGALIGFILARQLEDRVSHLFVLDKTDMVPRGLLREDLADEMKLVKATPAPAPPGRPGPGSQNRGMAQRLRVSGPTPTKAELEIVDRNRDWLQSVESQAVSKFEVFDAGGCNLVALPLGPNSRMLVVAAVPVDKINEKFLTRLNVEKISGSMLVDENMTAMAASRPALVGVNVATAGDDRLRSMLDAFRDSGYEGTRLVEQPGKVNGQDSAPSLVTAQPIEVVPGKKWFLLVGTPTTEVDRVVSGLFDRIVRWAVFVTILATALLVSTAVTLIRGRAKLERTRTDSIRRELERARQIQTAWLPHRPPACRSVEVAAVNYPAQHISGDFYNWFDLPDGRTAVVIGDVTGHGMSAAFLMATTQLLVRTTMQRIADPGECLTEVNRLLCSQVFNGQFVTMQLLVLNPAACTAELATAGHPAPLRAELDAAGRTTLKPIAIEPQLVLGVDGDAQYVTERLDLRAGGMLLLHTDGLADVEAPNGHRLGNDGVRRSLPPSARAPSPLDAAGLLDALVHKVNTFRGARALGDDLTLVAIRLAHSPTPAPAAAPAAATPAAAKRIETVTAAS